MRVRHLAVSSILALSIALGCAVREAHAGVTVDGAPCRYSARVTNGFTLYADALSTTALAHTAATFDVTLDGLTADVLATHVQVHATSVAKNRPAITFDAFTELASFELRTARDVTVVADHVWIRRNEVVSPLGAALGRMQIETPDGAWSSVAADVPCADVAFHPTTPDPIADAAFAARFAGLGVSVAMQLVAEDVAFRASPGGTIVYHLTRPPGSYVPMVEAYETKAGQTHVVYRGTPFVDAWVESDALEKPPMVSCWTCGGCGKIRRARILTYYEKRIPLLVDVPTELRLAPHGERVVATLPVGTALIGREDLDGWIRVELKDRELVAADGQAFWIPAADVTRTKWRRH